MSLYLGGGVGGGFARVAVAVGLSVAASPLSLVVVAPLFYGGAFGGLYRGAFNWRVLGGQSV